MAADQRLAELHRKCLDEPGNAVEACARALQAGVEVAAAVDLELQRVDPAGRMSVAFDHVTAGEGVVPDIAFANLDGGVFLALDLGKNVFPIGQQPKIDQCLYLESCAYGSDHADRQHQPQALRGDEIESEYRCHRAGVTSMRFLRKTTKRTMSSSQSVSVRRTR